MASVDDVPDVFGSLLNSTLGIFQLLYRYKGGYNRLQFCSFAYPVGCGC